MELPTLWKITVVKPYPGRKLKLRHVKLLGLVRCDALYAYELSFKRNDILIRPVIN